MNERLWPSAPEPDRLYGGRAAAWLLAGLLAGLTLDALAVDAPGARAASVSQSAGYEVGRLQVLEDSAGDTDLAAVIQRADAFDEIASGTPNFGFTSSTYWFRLSVRSTGDTSAWMFLDLKNPMLDRATLYVVGADGLRDSVTSGDRIAARERPFPATTVVLPFGLHAGESVELYFRVRTDASAMLVPWAIMDEASMRESLLRTKLFHGVILGIFGALFIYNLLLFAQLRSRAYLYYVIFLPFGFLSVTALNGFGQMFLYPWSTWLGNEGFVIFAGASFLMLLAFTRAFLRTQDHPRVDVWVRALMIVSAVLALSVLVVPVGVSYRVAVAMTFLFPLIAAMVGLTAWRRGKLEARFYILGQLASWIGMVVYGLMVVDVLPYRFLVYQSISIGLSLDALLMALALADRIRILQRATLLAEDTARRSLEVRKEELERLVTQRTEELEAARNRAERLATIDDLTGIANRRGLFEAAEREFSLALRRGRPLSAVMFDLDHFKRVNDEYGHADGDRVLRAIAQAVRKDVRSEDLFGRVGGEEFLVLLPETPKEAALQIAERMRARITQEVSVGEPSVAITASFGVACTSDGVGTFEQLQSRADAALYRAKRNGRNRVEALA